MSGHEHTGAGLFCTECGKEREPGSLKSVTIGRFIGRASLNPNVERFWETGDPAGLRRSDRAEA